MIRCLSIVFFSQLQGGADDCGGQEERQDIKVEEEQFAMTATLFVKKRAVPNLLGMHFRC